jgi:hypothetical protein
MRSVAEEAAARSTIHWLTRLRGIQWQPAIEAVRLHKFLQRVRVADEGRSFFLVKR